MAKRSKQPVVDKKPGLGFSTHRLNGLAVNKTTRLTIVLHKDHGVFCATVKEVPEIHTEGATKAEAVANVGAALKDLEDAKTGKLTFK